MTIDFIMFILLNGVVAKHWSTENPFTFSQLFTPTLCDRTNTCRHGHGQPICKKSNHNNQQSTALIPHTIFRTSVPMHFPVKKYDLYLPPPDGHYLNRPSPVKWPLLEPNPHQLISQRIKVNNEGNTSDLTAIIEGYGPYLCILRSSSELNSGVPSVFVRDNSFFRCYFQGGARKIGPRISGAGFYQCFYQRPGQMLTVRQGAGQYFCFFQGIRHTKGFIIPPPPPPGAPMMILPNRNFMEFLASVNYNIPSSTNGGTFQLLGLYTFGPEGSGRNFGLLQGRETYHLNLQSLSGQKQKQSLLPPGISFGIPDPENFDKDLDITLSSQVAVDQSGLFQYHFTGSEIDTGRADRFQSFAYNFMREYDAHLVTAIIVRYEIGGQGLGPEDDQDFVQIWGTYRCNLQGASVLPAFVQIIVITEYDFLGLRLPFDDGGLDYLQIILQYSEVFQGFEMSDRFTVVLTGAYQANGGDSDVMTDDPFANDDYFLTIVQLLYNFARQNGRVNGFLQFSCFYQFYLDKVDTFEAAEASPGYWQILGQYAKTYVLIAGKQHTATWTVQGIVEYCWPDMELSNGFVKIQGQVVFDTSALSAIWDDGKAKPSTVTLLGLYQCIWFGIRTFRPFCYFQLYAFYTGTIPGPVGTVGSGQGVLLWQYYQEVSH